MAVGPDPYRILTNRVAAFRSISATTFDADSTVDETSAAGQAVLKVAAPGDFTAGQTVLIADGTASEEVAEIGSTDGTSLILETNLAYEHLSGVAVVQGWYNNTVASASVQTWNAFWLLQGSEGLGVAIALRFMSALQVSRSFGTDEYVGQYLIAARLQVDLDNPTDQTNDLDYWELFHDINRAWTADFTCGGLAHDTRILSHRPGTMADYGTMDDEDDDLRFELPWVTLIASAEVDYPTARRDIYRPH